MITTAARLITAIHFIDLPRNVQRNTAAVASKQQLLSQIALHRLYWVDALTLFARPAALVLTPFGPLATGSRTVPVV